MITFQFYLSTLCILAFVFYSVYGCTSIVVSPGASSDKSSMITYNADSETYYGVLYHYPAGNPPPNSMRNIYDWDYGEYLGQIREAPNTYNVVGNVNEYGLLIAETTFGGIESLQVQKAAKIDYGSLIYVTLQRSKSAREAIQTISDLISEYGYASEGETFSIADQNEAWIMEIIGKGEYELGAVWVAMKVPDGYITAHANQARIQTFPLHDPENCLYSPDVISFARKIELYPTTAADEDFSFSDVYDPVDFSGARLCEARVWSVFSAVMGKDWSDMYLDYIQGKNLTNRMPLFLQPPQPLSVTNLMDMMRSHYEGTALDMQGLQISDVGAYTQSVYRVHPLTWTSKITPEGTVSDTTRTTYFHERPIATPQTGFNFVAQSRAWMPREMSALLWFGVDDSSTTVRFPIYGSATRIPKSFAGQGPQDGIIPPMMEFHLDAAFYVFNLVANWAYTRWDLMYPEILNAIQTKETLYIQQIEQLDTEILHRVSQQEDIKVIVEYTSKVTSEIGDQLTKEWLMFFGQLFVKYRDGYVIRAKEDSRACGCNAQGAGYPSSWLDRIVVDTKDHYVWDPESSSRNTAKDQQQQQKKNPAWQSRNKLTLRSLQ